jgi:endonuclease/exonuclease/phosphatase family metal-dependent hydrolase
MRTAICSVVMFLTVIAFAEDTKPATPSEPQKTLKFVTYNVLGDQVHIPSRVPALLKLLADSDADVIALQEVTPWFVVMLLKADFVKKYDVMTKSDMPTMRGEYVILSKVKLESIHYEKLPGHQRRGVLVGKFKLNNRNVAIATVHMESPLEDGPARAEQLDAIFPLLKDADDAVFLGDFNFGDGEQPDTDHLDKKYTDVWTALRPKDPGYTWNIETSDMAKEGSFPKETSRRIDRILVRSDVWRPAAVNIIGDKPVLEGRKDVFPSDHFGLQAELKFESK